MLLIILKCLSPLLYGNSSFYRKPKKPHLVKASLIAHWSPENPNFVPRVEGTWPGPESGLLTVHLESGTNFNLLFRSHLRVLWRLLPFLPCSASRLSSMKIDKLETTCSDRKDPWYQMVYQDTMILWLLQQGGLWVWSKKSSDQRQKEPAKMPIALTADKSSWGTPGKLPRMYS